MRQAVSPTVYKSSKVQLAFLVMLFIIIWFALILQITISIPVYLHNDRSLGGTLLEIFSFFTIQTNLLAAICLTALLFKPNVMWGRFFIQQYVLAGVALYITIVGLVYNSILRGLIPQHELFRVADELLHLVNPLLFVIYWLLFAPKTALRWIQALYWLWYPLGYFIYIIIRGMLSHYYPYPFINVDKFGLQQVLLNSAALVAIAYVMGLFFIWLSRALRNDIKASA